MKHFTIALGLAILALRGAEVLGYYFGFENNPVLRLIIDIFVLFIGVALIVIGVWWKSQKPNSYEYVCIITPSGYHSLEPSWVRRILIWLRNN